MDHRLRELAPVSDRAWSAIETEAGQALKSLLAARKLVDFEGPLGREVSGINTGHFQSVRMKGPATVDARLRTTQPLLELRRTFSLERSTIEAIDCGAPDADLGPVLEAARALSLAEDGIVFHGFEAAGIEGICSGSTHEPLTISTDYTLYPALVAQAIHGLVDAGIAGPYAIALGPRCLEGLMKTIHPNGLPVIDHVQRLLEGPVVRAVALDGAAVMSQRGGDFEIVCGEDVTLCYASHDEAAVELCLCESFTFRQRAPEAAVWLRYVA